jgi:putative phage-type endonuclease
MEQTIEQRTEEWNNQRKGKFTASEIYKLMDVKGLGKTGKTYAIEKAIEELYGKVDDDFISFDMQRGIEIEPLAFNYFCDVMDLKFIKVTNCGFFDNCEHSGASPDGLVGEDSILEIKCPKASTFFKLVATNDIDPKYYYQMQMQMIATKRNKGYFFNYIIIDGIEYSHTIEVLKNDITCKKMKERISEAVEIKKEYINKINKNKQF